jgi:hypothetical protein
MWEVKIFLPAKYFSLWAVEGTARASHVTVAKVTLVTSYRLQTSKLFVFFFFL